MLRTAAIIVLAGLAGCALPVVFVHRLDGDRFTSCLVSINDTEDDLRAQCGPPIRELSKRNGGRCVLYENLAHAIRTTDAPSPYVVACFEERGSKKKLSRVVGVYGLRALTTATSTMSVTGAP